MYINHCDCFSVIDVESERLNETESCKEKIKELHQKVAATRSFNEKNVKVK